MKELENKILAQNEEIEIFKNNTPHDVAKMILDEALELQEAVETAYLTDDLTSVVSELGDCFYLLTRFSLMLGISLEDALEVKIQRNTLKYKGQTDSLEARKLWEEKGGDKKYFNDLE